MLNNLPHSWRRAITASLMLVPAAVAAGIAHADDATPVVLTPQNAPQLANRTAILEATIVEVKYAQRRKLHFLSATANFRAESNTPVAIRVADIDQFHEAGIKDLSAQYLGHKIRARGTVIRDEDQWLLVVSSPRQIEVLDAAEGQAATRELEIIDEKGGRTTLAVPLAADLPRSKLTVEHDGNQDIFEGVTLSLLLDRAKIRLGAEARGNLLGRYIIVTGKDGYTAVFSLAEIDPYFVERPALVAERVNGGDLPTNRVPLQLIIPTDKHRRRWVGQIIRIEVRNALDPLVAKP